jgi:hypothetical protein
MYFNDLSDWIIVDGYCAARITKGGDVDNVRDRVAFIEKTPRVRLSKYNYGVEDSNGIGVRAMDSDAWVYGDKGSSEYGEDEESRKWCDDILRLLGWE